MRTTSSKRARTQRFTTQLAGAELVVSDRNLGSGGQAKVFVGRLNGRKVAVKVFHRSIATQKMKAHLLQVVQMAMPDERFVWPFDIVAEPLAVVMPLIPDNFRSIPDLLFDRVRPSFRALASICFELSDAFHQLHARGICYKDINANNVHFCPNKGTVRICDNENAAYDATEHVAIATPGYAAPELGRGETPCTIATDRHSLGTLLFELLFIAHPFRGKKESVIRCLSQEDEYDLFCRAPVFIFDPDDASNRPDPEVHKNALAYWPIYPTFLRDLFITHFTTGLSSPTTHRVLESSFRKAFVALYDSIYLCSTCQAEVFFDAKRTDYSCWKCRSRQSPPLRLRLVGKHEVVLHSATELFSHHLQANDPYNFTTVQAKVVVEPGTNRAGLVNLSAQKWTIRRAGTPLIDVLPGETVSLSRGTQIHFPGDVGEVIE